MTTTLRAPSSGDFSVIASWVSDAAACLRWAGPRVLFPFAADQLPGLLAIPDGGAQSYCLIDRHALVCGFGQHWVLMPGAVHLGRIIVSPDARGRGLGRDLCRHLISRATQATGANAVTLRVYRDNAVALALYASLGFTAVEAASTEDLLLMTMMIAQDVPLGLPPP